MRKIKALLLGGLVAAALVLPAAPAQASCDTELGDMCKFMDFVCGTAPKVTEKVIRYCQA